MYFLRPFALQLAASVNRRNQLLIRVASVGCSSDAKDQFLFTRAFRHDFNGFGFNIDNNQRFRKKEGADKKMFARN